MYIRMALADIIYFEIVDLNASYDLIISINFSRRLPLETANITVLILNEIGDEISKSVEPLYGYLVKDIIPIFSKIFEGTNKMKFFQSRFEFKYAWFPAYDNLTIPKRYNIISCCLMILALTNLDVNDRYSKITENLPKNNPLINNFHYFLVNYLVLQKTIVGNNEDGKRY
jgi:hypothetical protein